MSLSFKFAFLMLSHAPLSHGLGIPGLTTNTDVKSMEVSRLLSKLKPFFSTTLYIHRPPQFDVISSNNLAHQTGASIIVKCCETNLSITNGKYLQTFNQPYSTYDILTVVAAYPQPNLNQTTDFIHQLKLLEVTVPENSYNMFVVSAKESVEPSNQVPHSVTSKIKHGVVLTFINDVSYVRFLCPHCDHSEPSILPLRKLLDGDMLKQDLKGIIFPNWYKNFHGITIRASCLTTISRVQIRQVYGTYQLFKTGGLFPRAFVTITGKINATYVLGSQSVVTQVHANGTLYGGIMGEVSQGNADIGMAGLFSLIVHNAVDLSHMVDYGYLTFYVGPRLPIYSWISVVKPLATAVWLGCIISGLIALMFSSWLKFMIDKVVGDHSVRRWNSSRFLCIISSSFLSQPESTPVQDPLRLFFILWYAFTIVMTTAYQSNLYGFYVFPDLESSPSTFEELGTSNHHIRFTNFGGGISSYFGSAKPGSGTRKIFARMVSAKTDICFQAAIGGGRYACITFNGEMESFTHVNFGKSAAETGLNAAHDGALSAYAGFIFRKHSYLTGIMNPYVSRIFNAGLWLHWIYATNADRRDEVRATNRQTKSSKRAGDTLVKLNIKHMKGAITVSSVVVLLSCVVFVCEWSSTIDYGRKKFRRHV